MPKSAGVEQTSEDYHRKYLGPDPDALRHTGGRCAPHGGLAQTLLVPVRLATLMRSTVSDSLAGHFVHRKATDHILAVHRTRSCWRAPKHQCPAGHTY